MRAGRENKRAKRMIALRELKEEESDELVQIIATVIRKSEGTVERAPPR